MKLEVGMYVRTKLGEIGKIRAIIDNMAFINTNQYYSTIEKASHNLLGNDKEPCLIEVGDYVNGYLISDITDIGNKNMKAFEVFRMNGTGKIKFWEEEDIKSIVTKEQFESMSYKVGE